MSQKNLGAILLLIATVLGGPVAVEHALDVQVQVANSVAIEGPSECVVGELVELRVTGSRPSWLPPTSDAKNLGDTLILSFRDEGTYEVIASAIAGQSTQTVKHTITVGKDQSVVVIDVKPAPTPAPTPEPDHSGELTGLVYSWCIDAETSKSVAKELGDNFLYAATNSEDIDGLLSKVAERNRKIDQKTAAKVLAKIQQHLYDNLAGEDFTTHQCAFDEIGQGFLKYAGNVSTGFWK